MKKRVKKKLGIVILAFALLLSSFSGIMANMRNEVTPYALGETIAENFPDANLAQAIATLLGTGNVNDMLTPSMVDNCTYLDLSSKGIQDLTGLEIFVNLVDLQLNSNGFNEFTWYIRRFVQLANIKYK